MWTCPVCKRSFKNTKQDHSCEITDPELHFFNKDPNVKIVFQRLYDVVIKFDNVKMHSVKHAILFSAKGNFLAVKPKKHWLDIEFVLSHEVNGFPVHKTVKVSKSKWAHFVRLESLEEIDQELVHWLKDAYIVYK